MEGRQYAVLLSWLLVGLSVSSFFDFFEEKTNSLIATRHEWLLIQHHIEKQFCLFVCLSVITNEIITNENKGISGHHK